MLENTPKIDDVLFKGQRLLTNVIDHVAAVDLDMSTSQVTELSFTIEDPNFKILSSGIFDLNTKVTYRGLKLIVAVLETNDGGGQGGLSVRCRPEAVSKLKQRVGTLVMSNISPSAFVLAECSKAGITALVDPKSSVRSRIARDLPQKGQQYDEAARPSTWTTMQRLAGEAGFLMYEIGGKLFFGRPTWLIQSQPKVEVPWYPENGKEPYSIPEFRHSIDNKDVDLSLILPLSRAGEVFPGYGITVSGFPKFAGTYMINSVNYPLIGGGTVSVSASTVKNPEVQKGGDQNGGGGSGSSTPSVSGGGGFLKGGKLSIFGT
jgi:hypothetical protein